VLKNFLFISVTGWVVWQKEIQGVMEERMAQKGKKRQELLPDWNRFPHLTASSTTQLLLLKGNQRVEPRNITRERWDM